MYHSGEREVQRRAGVLEAADRVRAGVHRALTGHATAFQAKQSFAVAASTAGSPGSAGRRDSRAGSSASRPTPR